MVEQLSVDEIYVDVPKNWVSDFSNMELGLKIGYQIFKPTRATCSTGVARTKFLAKLASSVNKPNVFFEVEPKNLESFLKNIPIQKVPGLGRKMAKTLMDIGINRLGEIKHYSSISLKANLSFFAIKLFQLSKGNDYPTVLPWYSLKLISVEHTFDSDLVSKALVENYILCQADHISYKLRHEDWFANFVSLKVKDKNLNQFYISKQVLPPINLTRQIFYAVQNIFAAYKDIKNIRLIGITVSKLKEEETVLPKKLRTNKHIDHVKKWNSIERKIDKVNIKFGKSLLIKASMISTK